MSLKVYTPLAILTNLLLLYIQRTCIFTKHNVTAERSKTH